MLITRLKNAELVYDGELGTYYFNLTYEEESDSKIITYTYERVPITFSNEPVYALGSVHTLGGADDAKKYQESKMMDFGYGPVPMPITYRKRIDGYMHKVHNVTLRELEEILGFPVNIIDDEAQMVSDSDSEPKQEPDVPIMLFGSSSQRPERITIMSDEEFQKSIYSKIIEDGEQSNDGGEKNEDQ